MPIKLDYDVEGRHVGSHYVDESSADGADTDGWGWDDATQGYIMPSDVRAGQESNAGSTSRAGLSSNSTQNEQIASDALLAQQLANTPQSTYDGEVVETPSSRMQATTPEMSVGRPQRNSTRPQYGAGPQNIQIHTAGPIAMPTDPAFAGQNAVYNPNQQQSFYVVQAPMPSTFGSLSTMQPPDTFMRPQESFYFNPNQMQYFTQGPAGAFGGQAAYNQYGNVGAALQSNDGSFLPGFRQPQLAFNALYPYQSNRPSFPSFTDTNTSAYPSRFQIQAPPAAAPSSPNTTDAAPKPQRRGARAPRGSRAGQPRKSRAAADTKKGKQQVDTDTQSSSLFDELEALDGLEDDLSGLSKAERLKLLDPRQRFGLQPYDVTAEDMAAVDDLSGLSKAERLKLLDPQQRFGLQPYDVTAEDMAAVDPLLGSQFDDVETSNAQFGTQFENIESSGAQFLSDDQGMTEAPQTPNPDATDIVTLVDRDYEAAMEDSPLGDGTDVPESQDDAEMGAIDENEITSEIADQDSGSSDAVNTGVNINNLPGTLPTDHHFRGDNVHTQVNMAHQLPHYNPEPTLSQWSGKASSNGPLMSAPKSTAPLESLDVMQAKWAKFQEYLIAHFEDDDAIVAPFNSLCSAFSRGDLTENNLYAGIYHLVYLAKSENLTAQFKKFLPASWLEKGLQWLETTVAEDIEEKLDMEPDEELLAVQYAIEKQKRNKKKTPINGFRARSSTVPMLDEDVADSDLPANDLGEVGEEETLPEVGHKAQTPEANITRRRSHRPSMKKADVLASEMDEEIEDGDEEEDAPGSPDDQVNDPIDTTYTPTRKSTRTPKPRRKLGDSDPDTIPHYGRIFATRREILARYDRPYICGLCGESFIHPADVSLHHGGSRTTERERDNGCWARYGKPGGADGKWNKHESCGVGMADINYAKVKGGFVILDQESLDKIEAAVEQGRKFKKENGIVEKDEEEIEKAANKAKEKGKAMMKKKKVVKAGDESAKGVVPRRRAAGRRRGGKK